MSVLEEGFVCGSLCGGGSVCCSKKTGNYSFTLRTSDKQFADVFLLSLSNISQTEPKVREAKKGGKTRYTVQLYGKKTVKRLLKKWNNRFGTRDWTVPDMAYDSKRFRRGFLSGFFEVKGYIRVRFRGSGKKRTKVRNVRVKSVNHKGLKEVEALLSLEDVDCNIYKSGKCWCLDIEGKRRVSKFHNRVGFATKDKRDMVIKAVRN